MPLFGKKEAKKDGLRVEDKYELKDVLGT